MKHVWTLEKSSTYVTFEPNLLLFFFQFWSCDDSTTVMLDVFGFLLHMSRTLVL